MAFLEVGLAKEPPRTCEQQGWENLKLAILLAGCVVAFPTAWEKAMQDAPWAQETVAQEVECVVLPAGPANDPAVIQWTRVCGPKEEKRNGL